MGFQMPMSLLRSVFYKIPYCGAKVNLFWKNAWFLTDIVFLDKIFYFEYTDFEELVSAAFAVNPGSESPGGTGSFCLSMAASDSRVGIQR